MQLILSDRTKTRLLAATYMALGYEACGGTTGMGFLQERDGVDASNITKFCAVKVCVDGTVEFQGDYVAGRMMKTWVLFNEKEGWVEISDNKPTPDYQGWCSGIPQDPGVLSSFRRSSSSLATKYASYEALMLAAAEKLGVSFLGAPK